jgi:hypothetical protein
MSHSRESPLSAVFGLFMCFLSTSASSAAPPTCRLPSGRPSAHLEEEECVSEASSVEPPTRGPQVVGHRVILGRKNACQKCDGLLLRLVFPQVIARRRALRVIARLPRTPAATARPRTVVPSARPATRRLPTAARTATVCPRPPARTATVCPRTAIAAATVRARTPVRITTRLPATVRPATPRPPTAKPALEE